MADQKITQLVDGGAPQATDEFVIARAGDNFKIDYASIDSNLLDQAVILAPAASTRNVIIPTAGTVIAAIVKAHAAQSVDLTQWQTSAGVMMVGITASGKVVVTPAVLTAKTDPAISVLDPPLVGPGAHFSATTFASSYSGNENDAFYGINDWQLRITEQPGAAVGERSSDQTQTYRRVVDGKVIGFATTDGFGSFSGELSTEALSGVYTTNPVVWASYVYASAAYGFQYAGVQPNTGLQLWMDQAATDPLVQILNVGGTKRFAIFGGTPVVQQAASSLAALWTGLKNYGWLTAGSTVPSVYEPGGTDVAVADGGTGASTAAGAQTNLDVPSNATLAAAVLHNAYAYLRDEQATTVNAGGFTSGSWVTRVLNTEVFDTDGFVSLASNQFTLAAGTYFIKGRAPGLRCSTHKLRLQNITDTATVAVGSSAYSNVGTGDGHGYAWLTARVTIAGTKAFELQHRCAVTRATDGLGVASSIDSTTEVYAEVEIWRETP